MEEYVGIERELGVIELRQLQEFSKINGALTREEFMKIVSIYNDAINRLLEEARKQGVEV